MKCPKCQTDNPDAKKFCRECGTKLSLRCPQCGSEYLLGDRFCGECGHDLTPSSKPIPTELSFDEKLTKIQKYLPGGLTEKILSQRGKIEGERKQVTVLFCDMENFTPLVEKLGHEEAFTLMDKVYEILIHKVHEFEGTVNDLSGDGMMALFGAPIALEDAPQRAIRSALSIHREIIQFSDRMKQEKAIPPVRMRVGIHTGPVVVGALGNDLRVQFTAVGDTVNLASRLQNLADPGTTFVTEDTFKLTEGFFRFEALGEKKVKGREQPVRVYRVIAPSTRRTKFDVSAERGLTPFVGRERGLKLLLDGFERVKEGRGRAFSIVGEAGVGKSRLLYEFRKAVADEDVTFLEGKCLSYGRGIAYSPIIDILKSNFDIKEGDIDSDIRSKVITGIKLPGMDVASTLPYLLELLSVKDSGIDKIFMSPESRKDRIIEALKQIVLKGSEIRPLIIAIEDLHWIDKSSEDALKYFLETLPAVRVLLTFTYRPEFVHTWGGKSYYNQINLTRLSNLESLSMAAHLLGTQEIDKDLEKVILEKTEGIPFFIEELLKALKDLRIIERKDSKYQFVKDVKGVAIPSTIQDVIMARVDSLPDAARTVLQTGSVIEREFTYDLIKRVTGLPEQQLLTNLSCLKDSELLYERGIYPQTSYIFRHALTREVVYDSILARKKKELHEEIGKGIEELYKNNLAEHYGVLAEHFIESENYEKGAEYSGKAGRKAEKSASLTDAITYAKRSVFCVEKLPQNEAVYRKLIDAKARLCSYLTQQGNWVEAKKTIDPIIELARNYDYKRRLCQLYATVGAYYTFVEFDKVRSYKFLEDALRISGEVNDHVTKVLTNNWYGYTLGWNCEFDKAEEHLRDSLNINLFINNLWGISILKANLAYICFFLQGKLELACQYSNDAIAVAEKSGDILSRGVANTAHGIILNGKGLLQSAEKYLLLGVELCERAGISSWSILAFTHAGQNYFDNGEFEKSKAYYETGLHMALECQVFVGLSEAELGVARAKAMNKEYVDLNSLLAIGEKIRVPAFKGWDCMHIGQILMHIDDCHQSDAEAWFQKGIEFNQKNVTKFYLGKNYALYAEFLKRKGERLKTRENLGRAIEILKECGADGWVEKYEKELAKLA